MLLAASCLARRPEHYDESAACRPHCDSDTRLHVIAFHTPHFANITALFFRSLHAAANRDERLTEQLEARGRVRGDWTVATGIDPSPDEREGHRYSRSPPLAASGGAARPYSP